MKTYKLVAKFENELDSDHVTFSASSLEEANAKANEWNRYHSRRPYKGWGYQVAAEDNDSVPAYDWFFS